MKVVADIIIVKISSAEILLTLECIYPLNFDCERGGGFNNFLKWINFKFDNINNEVHVHVLELTVNKTDKFTTSSF